MGPTCAKYFRSDMLGRAANRSVQIDGGVGYMRGGAVERLDRDVRLFRIQQLVIARELLGTM